MVLDMATTVVSYGTVKNYALQGKPMEKGWMVNTATGEDITDARRAAEGLLLPIGGYKGSGLAIMLGLIAGPLNRALFGRDVIDFNADDASETNTGHFIVALDVARFLPLADYKAEVDRHIRELKESKRLPGVDEIRMPGERRRQCRDDRTRNGVPLAPPLVAQLDTLAAQLGIAPFKRGRVENRHAGSPYRAASVSADRARRSPAAAGTAALRRSPGVRRACARTGA